MALFLLLLGSVPAGIMAQTPEKRITCKCKNMKLADALHDIERQSGYYRVQFTYGDVDGLTAAANVNGLSAPDAVRLLLSGTHLECSVRGQFIYINKVKGKPEATRKAGFVNGIVTSQDGEPLIGANVSVKGKAGGVSTDVHGRFAIQAGTDDVLVVRYLGMDPAQVPVKSRGDLKVSLRETTMPLEETVVVSNGYQKISKERSTASFGFVNNKELNRQMHKDLTSALEGQVAGLRMDINPNTGESSPVLRGVGTFSSNVGTQPLIVVDNMATNLTLEDINPYTVESITVLKDAAAASIYGALAANGVIVVTTKQAKNNGVKVDVNADWFISTKPSLKSMHYASAGDIIDFQTDMYNARVSNAGGVENFFNTYGTNYYSPLYQLYRDQAEGNITDEEVSSTLAKWRGNNYYEQFRDNAWRTAVTQRYNVSLSSRTVKDNHYLSFGYEHSNNRLINDRDNAFSLYYKSNFKIKKWLSVNAGVDVRLAKSVAPETQPGLDTQDVYTSIYDADGNAVYQPVANISGYAGGSINATTAAKYADTEGLKSYSFNVIDVLNENMNKSRSTRIRPFVSAEARFLGMFKYSMMYQYEWAESKNELQSGKDSYMMRLTHNAFIDQDGNSQLPEGDRYYSISASTKRYTLRNQLNFDKVFNGHAVNAIAGLEFRENHVPVNVEQLIYGYNAQTLTGQRMDWNSLATEGIMSLVYDNAVKMSGLGTRKTDVLHRYASFYANAGYSYKYKYNITASIRWDEADLFGLDTKEQKHPLWSLGTGWNVTAEDFMRNVTWMDYLKLRATYGINGNVDQSSTTYFVATYKTVSTSTHPLGLTYLKYDDDDLPNPKLRWEKTATTNIGLDFRVLGNRLSGSVDYYNRHSSDLLVRRYMDSTLGATSRVVNNGEIRNRGVELTLNGTILQTKDWTLTANLSYAHNNNKVLDVDEDATTTASSYIKSPQNYFKEGESYNSLWAYRLSRVVNGYPVILDAEGNEMAEFDEDGNVVSVTLPSTLKGTDALVNKGSLTPTFNGSFGLNLRWRDLELNTFFVYAGGNKLRLDVADLSESGYDMRSTHVLDRWTENNTGGVRMYIDMDDTGRQYASVFDEWWAYSDMQVKDADYLKLRSLSLSYNLPKLLCGKIGITAARFTLQVNNLFTWCKAGNDIDPESYGLNTGTRVVNQPKTISIGFSTSF